MSVQMFRMYEILEMRPLRFQIFEKNPFTREECIVRVPFGENNQIIGSLYGNYINKERERFRTY